MERLKNYEDIKSDDGSDACHSRGLQKITDLTRLPYDVANSFQYYTFFYNMDYSGSNVLTNETEYIDSYGSYYYEYDIDDVFVYPNQTQYFKLRQFLAYSANERNMQTIHRRHQRHRRSNLA